MEIKQIEDKYLKEYDYLKDTVYLDCARLGLPPKRTKDFCKRFMDEFADSFGQLALGPYGQRREAVRETLAKLIHCSPAEISFVANTTEGNSILASCMSFKPGDSVIITDMDYHGNNFCWLQKQLEGIQVKLAKSHNGTIDADELIALMDDTTKVVSLSFVQFGSGFQADLKKIGLECRKRNIYFSVDGIQGLGRIPVDVQEMKIDLLSCAAFKGMLGPIGAAFVYCRTDVMKLLKPWAYGDNCNIEEMKYGENARDLSIKPLYEDHRRLEAGALNNYGILALGISAALLNEIGIDVIYQRVMDLEAYYRNLIKEAKLPVQILGSEDSKHWSGNICFNFEACYSEKLKTLLEKNKIYVTLQEGFLRTGIHYYNKESDIEQLIKALKEAFWGDL